MAQVVSHQTFGQAATGGDARRRDNTISIRYDAEESESTARQISQTEIEIAFVQVHDIEDNYES